MKSESKNVDMYAIYVEYHKAKSERKLIPQGHHF